VSSSATTIVRFDGRIEAAEFRPSSLSFAFSLFPPVVSLESLKKTHQLPKSTSLHFPTLPAMSPVALDPSLDSSSLPSLPPTTPAPKPGKADVFDAGKVQTGAKSMNFPAPPVWPETEEGKLAERKHKLERLAGAFRIAGKMGCVLF
jgi:hypothetical protein